jgi:hypothetical protein
MAKYFFTGLSQTPLMYLLSFFFRDQSSPHSIIIIIILLIGHQFVIVYHSLFDFDDPSWKEKDKHQLELKIKLILNLNPYFFFRINKKDIMNHVYFSTAIAIQAVTGTIMMFVFNSLLKREMSG